MSFKKDKKDITPNPLPVIAKRDKLVMPVNWRDITGSTKADDNATKNEFFAQDDAPTEGYKEGDIWFNTNDDNHPYRANSSLTWVSMRDAGAGSVQTTIFYQSSAPSSGMVTGDYWIDSDDNKLYYYDGASWGEVQDDDIASAIADAATAQATADGKIKVFKQTSAPTAEGTGDLWIDSDDDNKLYRWSGSAWEDVRDAGIAQAIADAATAQATADGKVVTFLQTTAPTAEGTGDLWLDSDDGYKAYRWSGAAWVEIQDTDIAQALSDAATAQTTADSKIISFYQTSAPTAEGTGDIWLDSDDDNKPYRWSGSAWVAAEFDVAAWSKILDDDSNKPDDNATQGAKSGTNLVDESDATLSDADIVTEEGSALSTFQSFTTGENITQGDALVGVKVDQEQATNDELEAFGKSTGTQEIAQSFQTGLSDTKLFGVILALATSGTPTDNVYVTIEGDSGGSPDGSPIATSADVLGVSVGDETEFVLATPVALTASTTYWIVAQRDGALSDANFYDARYKGDNSSDAYSDGTMKVYAGAWAAKGGDTYEDLRFRTFYMQDDTVFRSSAVYEMVADSFLGFAQTTVTSGNAIKSQLNGVLTKTGASFTRLKEYYLTDSAGAIGTTAGTYSRKVGKALNATKILLDKVTD